jgi:hypothetical protein
MNNLEDFIVKFKEQFIDADEIDFLGNTVFREVGSWDSLTGMAILIIIFNHY